MVCLVPRLELHAVSMEYLESKGWGGPLSVVISYNATEAYN